MSLATMLYSVCLPFMLFTYMLKGYDIPSMLTTMAIGFIVSAATTMIALVIGAVTSGRILGLIVAAIAFLMSFYVSIGLSVGMAVFLHEGVLEIFHGTHSLYFSGSILVVVLLSIRLAEAMAVGLVSAPSSNRTLDFRIWSTIFLVVTGCVIAGIFYFFSTFVDRELIFLWALIATQMVVFVMVVGISEPEGYSTRLLRQRPKSGLFRLLSLPYMAGVTGGIFWAALHVVAVILLSSLAFELSRSHYTSHHYYYSFERDYNGLILWTYYMFAYGLTARLLMRTVLKRIPAKFGWGVMLLLMAVLILLSILISFLVLPGRFYDSHEWMLFNPFVAIDQSDPDAYYFFSLAWAIAALALNMIYDMKNFIVYMTTEMPVDDSAPAPVVAPIIGPPVVNRQPSADEGFGNSSPASIPIDPGGTD